MARAGILYSDVAKAAAQIAADGKNPTVDGVREALGGTGSKSTIAPFLKRWKTEHQETIAEAQSGLPSTLLQAIKGLHQHMQVEVNQKLDEARQEHAAALQAAAETEQQLRTELQSLSAANTTLSLELEHARQALTQLQATHHAQTVVLATAHSENTGLQQRLTDRAAEVASLNQQLSQTRTQFEHYQEATAVQRAEERQAAEQRIHRLEQDLAGTNRHILMQQSTIAQQEASLSHLTDENGRLQEAVTTVQASLVQVRAEREQWSYQAAELGAVRKELSEKLNQMQQALTEARMASAAQAKETEMLTQTLRRAEGQVERLDHEKQALLQQTAGLEARLRQLQDADDTARQS